jgi:hypothetical protein
MRKTAGILISLCLVLIFIGIAFAEDFSADILTRNEAGAFQGKVYVAKSKIRMEMAGAVNITRLDKNTSWMLMPDQKKYMDLPMDLQNVVAGQDKMPGEMQRELVGQETIEGRKADKYRIVYSSKGQKQVIYTWLLSDINMPVRTQAEDNSWMMEYRNISVGSQPDELFEIPAGYEKISMSMPSFGDLDKIMNQLGQK